MAELDKEKWFYVHGDGVIKTLEELPEALRTMSLETYAYHTRDKNDFAQWIREIFQLEGLADSIIGKDKEEAARIIEEWLNQQDKEQEVRDEEKLREIISRIDERFNDKIEALFPTLEEVMPPEVKQKIEELEEKLKDIELKMSEERKNGYEFFKTPLLIRMAESKINIARSSWTDIDLEKASRAVEEVLTTHDLELKEAEKIKRERQEFEREYLLNEYKG
ncbi:hypothetical protein J7K74_03040 [Candidatus Woesearchaeota archaeon]|nr:hypothetical protein [Candidatus Woesearchaeota archaeon]